MESSLRSLQKANLTHNYDERNCSGVLDGYLVRKRTTRSIASPTVLLLLASA